MRKDELDFLEMLSKQPERNMTFAAFDPNEHWHAVDMLVRKGLVTLIENTEHDRITVKITQAGSEALKAAQQTSGMVVYDESGPIDPEVWDKVLEPLVKRDTPTSHSEPCAMGFAARYPNNAVSDSIAFCFTHQRPADECGNLHRIAELAAALKSLVDATKPFSDIILNVHKLSGATVRYRDGSEGFLSRSEFEDAFSARANADRLLNKGRD